MENMREKDSSQIFESYWRHLDLRKSTASIRRSVLKWYPTVGLNEVEQIIFNKFKECPKILDIGAGDNSLKKKFIKHGYKGVYETFDISREFEHNYYNLDEITGNYDGIIMLEVIEHMELLSFLNILDNKIEKILNPCGVLAVSTPNPASINSMWASDLTHIQQYPLQDLLAILFARGYECEAFRVLLLTRENISIIEKARLFLKKVITSKILEVDYAQGLLIIARKMNIK